MQDDDNHIDMTAGFANMRARNYRIPEVDDLKVKFIVGKIIPNIVTSTAMITGLVCLELYKVLDGGHKVEDYRNTVANLALPLFTMARPVPPEVIKHKDMSWTFWDRWILKDNPTLRVLLDWLRNKGLRVFNISYENNMLYNLLIPKHKKRLHAKLEYIVKHVTNTELPANRKHFDLSIVCEDEDGNDVDIPKVSVYFK